jgi:hypothetical protein
MAIRTIYEIFPDFFLLMLAQNIAYHITHIAGLPIDKLLLERIPLACIARITGVSERWLQKYVNDKYDNVPQRVIVSQKSKGRLTIECDEVWSFVKQKKINNGFG